MNIAVFCSANEVSEKYIEPIKEFAEELAKRGHSLVYGGVDLGLMKIVADGVQQHGGRVIGVSMEPLRDLTRKNADEMTITKNVSERKKALLERADGIVVLVGGIGTLDELTEMVEYKRRGHHSKKIVVLNTAGFYDGLKMQLQRIADEGLLPVREIGEIESRPLDRWIHFVDTPQKAMRIIEGK